MLANFKRHWPLPVHKFYQWRPGGMKNITKEKNMTKKVAAVAESGCIVICEI